MIINKTAIYSFDNFLTITWCAVYIVDDETDELSI